MAKRVMPYERLRKAAWEFYKAVVFAERVTMWVYPTDKLAENWRLDNLAERVQAAEQLGFDVRLRWLPAGLVVEYVRKTPTRPVEF